jgi:hypothetical protein
MTADYSMLLFSSGTTDLGDGTWTVQGTPGAGFIYVYSDVVDGQSTVVLHNSDIWINNHRTLNNVIALGDCTSTGTGSYRLTLDGTLDIDGTFTIPTGNTTVVGRATVGVDPLPKLKVNSGSTIQGGGWFRYKDNVEDMEIASNVTWNNSVVHFIGCTTTIPARTWANGQVTIEGDGTGVYTFAPGTHTFQGNVLMQSSEDCTYDMSNNPDFNYQSNLTISNKVTSPTYNKGTGTIRFTEGSNQNVNLNNLTVEDIIVFKSGGTITFTGDATTDSFIGEWGNIDFNGQNITTLGSFEIREQADMDPTNLSGTDLVIGGDAYLWGAPGDLMDIDSSTDWTYTITGDAAAYYVSAGNSNAGGGSTVYAYYSLDALDNTNWVFAEVVAEEAESGVTVGGGFAVVDTDHVYATADCNKNAWLCNLKMTDQYCIEGTYFRNLGSRVFNRDYVLTRQDQAGSNTEERTSQSSVALTAPITLCRQDREEQEEEIAAQTTSVRRVERPMRAL